MNDSTLLSLCLLNTGGLDWGQNDPHLTKSSKILQWSWKYKGKETIRNFWKYGRQIWQEILPLKLLIFSHIIDFEKLDSVLVKIWYAVFVKRIFDIKNVPDLPVITDVEF